MTVVRLTQGAVFALIFSDGSAAATETRQGRSAIVSGVLLVVSIMLFVTAAQNFSARTTLMHLRQNGWR